MSEHNSEVAGIEYYGEKLNTPIKLKIINDGAKVYISVDSSDVEIIDNDSEIKIHNGIFEQKEQGADIAEIDMSALPPVVGDKLGKLFNFKSSFKSAYSHNFRKHKKGIRALRRCMFLFALAIVFMACTFGTAFGDMLNAKDSYSHNTFYVYTPDSAVSDKLLAAVGDEETGIDFIRLQEPYNLSDINASFKLGMFETFEISPYDTDFYANAVLMDMSVGAELELVAGVNKDLAENDILITTKLADALLNKSSVGYISKYADLVGLLCADITVNGKSVRIAGVAESDESAVFMSEIAMARYVKSNLPLSKTALASDFGVNTEDGKVVLVRRSLSDGVIYPSIGDKVTIQGVELEISEIIVIYGTYDSWLDGNGKTKLDRDSYCEQIVSTEFPELTAGSFEYKAKVSEIRDTRYFEYYDYYYAELDEFLRSFYLIGSDQRLWLYFDKGIADIRYCFCDPDYYKAAQYRKMNGKYPSKTELDIVADDFDDIESIAEEYMYIYIDEYTYSANAVDLYVPSYLVSEKDYISLSKRVGDNHTSANEDYKIDTFTAVHSTDPRLTEEWLMSEFSDLSSDYYKVIMTPDDIFDEIIRDRRENIVSSVVALTVMLVLMSLCMYFIMRSSLMNRIKEVGIYRAIGVSKKNLIFRFLIEAAVLSAMTVLLGYFAVSAFIYVGFSISTLVSDILFYPLWYAFIVLVVIVGISLVCGILPIVFLLRKTPSEILAKYDI